MRGDCLPDLDAAHIILGRIPVDHSALKHLSVKKAHISDAAVLVWDYSIVARCDNVVAIGLKSRIARGIVDAVAFIEAHGLLDYLAASGHRLELDHGLWCLVLRDDDVLKVEVAVGSAHVLELEALHLDALDQLLVEGVQRIKRIHEVVLLAMGCRVVEHEEGVESCHALPGGRSFLAHLLGLINDNDRIVGCDYVNGPAASKVIALVEDDPGCLVVRSFFHGGVEGLHIDDHHVDV